MGLFSEEELFGMTIRESANDGSDFTNPSADYRRLFLGEDGQLHVKDSAGTVTDIGGGSSGIPSTIFDVKGDIIAASAADTAARLAAGSNGAILFADSAQSTGLIWAKLQSSKVDRSNVGSDLTTTSTTWADVDGTNLTATFTSGARRVMLIFLARLTHSSSGAVTRFSFGVDSTGVVSESAGSAGLHVVRANAASASHGVAFTFVTDVLSAGSHTFRPRWNTSAATATLVQTATDDHIVFEAIELPIF